MGTVTAAGHWLAGNWDDPLSLAIIALEIAFFTSLFFVPDRWKDAVKQLAHDDRIPWPIEAMLAFGSLPIIGPVDEIVGGIAILIVICTPRMRAAFSDAIATGRSTCGV